eukprot:1026497-Amorphochlora_amoeboformis.AAC.1
MEEGKKWEGTTLFRWKPDYFSAQKAYEEAAKLFRKGRNYTRWVSRFQGGFGDRSVQSGEVWKEVSNAFEMTCELVTTRLLKGASELETGALEAMSEVKDTKLPTKILEKAASWYREKGSIDRNVTRHRVTAYPDRKEGDPVSSTDTYEACVAALVRNGLFDAADEC